MPEGGDRTGVQKAAPTGPEALGAFSAYGIPLGEAFQLRDDLLGVFGRPDRSTARDERAGLLSAALKVEDVLDLLETEAEGLSLADEAEDGDGGVGVGAVAGVGAWTQIQAAAVRARWR